MQKQNEENKDKKIHKSWTRIRFGARARPESESESKSDTELMAKLESVSDSE